MMKKNNALFLIIMFMYPTMSCANIGSGVVWVARKATGVVFLGLATLCSIDSLRGFTRGLPMGILLPASFGKSYNLLVGENILSDGTKSNVAKVAGVGLYTWATGRSIGHLRLSLNNLNPDDKAHLILTIATAWQAFDCAHDLWNNLQKKLSTSPEPCEQTVVN